jgi:hypothetical protein
LVEDPETVPWVVVVPVKWEAVIYATPTSDSDAQPMFFVFESGDVAQSWAEKHGMTDFDWSSQAEVEAAAETPPEGCSEAFEQAARAQGVDDVHSPEAVDAALKDDEFRTKFHSLIFYRNRGRVRSDATPPWPTPSGRTVRVPWTPASCSHRGGTSDMWNADRSLHLGLSAPQVDLDQLPFAVEYARTS